MAPLQRLQFFYYPNRNEGEENLVLFFTSAKSSVGEEEIYLFDYPKGEEEIYLFDYPKGEEEIYLSDYQLYKFHH